MHDYYTFAINNELKNIIFPYENQSEYIDYRKPRIKDYKQTSIESDVWTGEFVTVKGEITIEDGAVIATLCSIAAKAAEEKEKICSTLYKSLLYGGGAVIICAIIMIIGKNALIVGIFFINFSYFLYRSRKNLNE